MLDVSKSKDLKICQVVERSMLSSFDVCICEKIEKNVPASSVRLHKRVRRDARLCSPYLA